MSLYIQYFTYYLSCTCTYLEVVMFWHDGDCLLCCRDDLSLESLQLTLHHLHIVTRHKTNPSHVVMETGTNYITCKKTQG